MLLLKAKFTIKIKTGTSICSPMTAVNAARKSVPNTAIATAMPNSELLPAAVNANVVDF